MDEKSNLLASDTDSSVTALEGRTEPASEFDTEQDSGAKKLESYLRAAGFGFFHVLFLIVVGISTAADAVEVFSISFVLPIAEHDLDITTASKGWLIASIFIGMLFGGYVWGSFADVFGRKVTLGVAMLWNGVSGLVSAFSPNFAFFLIFRLASGIGIGGSIPVVFSYVSEFFTEKQRGPIVIIVASCWQPGSIFTAFLAWALMGTEGPHSEISFYIGSLHFVHWRLFLILCTIPAFVAAISLLFLPESPAYLFNSGRIQKFLRVLRCIHRVNSISPCCLVKREKSKDSLTLITSELLEMKPTSSDDHDSITYELESMPKAQNACKDCPLFVLDKLKQIGQATVGIFRLEYLRSTLLLLVIWFIQMFAYYGTQLWFPEYFRRLDMADSILDLNTTAHFIQNGTNNGTNLQFYKDTLYTAVASLPGNIIGLLLINIIGGRIQTALAMILSAGTVFAIFGIPNHHTAVVAVSCLFSAITVTVFGALDVINTVVYDVDLRSTAFGVHSGVGRLGAILGNVMFGHLLDVHRGIPIVIVASLLTVGAIAAILLPQIYRAENKPPLERLLHQLGKKCKACLKRSH